MTETELKTLLSGITPPDEAARAAAHAHWAGLAKPLGGLGALETLLEDAAALTGSAALDVSRRAVLVLCSEAMDPLTLVRCYPIGYISMLDGGKNDEKIIAIPFTDPGYNGHRELTDLPAHIFDEMAHFFAVYKALEGKEAVPGDVNGRAAAVEVIQRAIDHYVESFCR